MAPLRKGTPNNGLELIFNTLPVEVYLQKMATKAYFRTMQHAPFTKEQMHTSVVSRRSHRSWISNLIIDQGLEYLEGPLDVVPLHRRWDRKFEVDTYSMSHKNPTRGIPDIRGVNIYTDGSKNSDSSGAGVVIREGGNTVHDSEGNERIYSYNLGKNTTVFQSEVFAQKMAATLITNISERGVGWLSNRHVTINSDNQASLYALNNIWVKSLLV